MSGRIAALTVAWLMLASRAQAQDPVKDAPPASEDFEADADGDGVPDRWYNLRDVQWVGSDGPVGPKFFRFEETKPGRPARVSRGFTISGKETEALILGLWVRVEGIHPGDRVGEDPSVQIDFFGERLVPTGRHRVGPFTHRLGKGWVHVAKRLQVPPDTQGAILTMGLLGAVGKMDVDGLTVEKVPVGGSATTNLILNGDCELGLNAPDSWTLEDGARRISPGHNHSTTAVELPSSLDKALVGVAVRADHLRDVVVRAAVKASGLRGGGGARATMYFLDADGRPLAGSSESEPLFSWSGSFGWKVDEVRVRVPASTERAVIQFERSAGNGTLAIDDVEVFEANNGQPLSWTPYHDKTDTEKWQPFAGSPKIEPQSALDASFLLESPAGKHGAVGVKDGRLHFADGSRARFFGVALLPPLAFPEASVGEALADRLARSGVNLVKFDALDAAFGPGRSLYDDSRDDTQALDPDALARFDHLVAALKARGIYLAIELENLRKFREEDKVPGWIGLPLGGGPAAAFDPTIRRLIVQTAELLLGHKNPETGFALRDDPVLAWVAIAGELSLFNLLDDGEELPVESAAELKALVQKGSGTGRTAWKQIEANQWKGVADDLRKLGVKHPIAGSSHWRRESEFDLAQATAGLDLIEDRLYWSPPRFGAPERRSMLWKPSTSLTQEAQRKRRPERPYVVGEYAGHTGGAWSLPYEGADFLLAARTAAAEDWDALVRRGIFLHPQSWGKAAPGTSGGQDLFSVPEVVNAIPPVFSLLPHAGSLVLRPTDAGKTHGARRPTRGMWDAKSGVLVVDTPYTQGVAGWTSRKLNAFETLSIEVDSPHGVVVVSSAGTAPIAETHRLLVTAVGRAEPTGLLYADPFRRDVADPGRMPMLVEPVRARVSWKRKGSIKAYALDPTGARSREVRLEKTHDGVRLELDGASATLHWELIEG